MASRATAKRRRRLGLPLAERAADERVNLTRHVIVLDHGGITPLLVDGDLAFLLELAGRYNGRQDRDRKTYLASADDLADTLAGIIAEAKTAAPAFANLLAAALKRAEGQA